MNPANAGPWGSGLLPAQRIDEPLPHNNGRLRCTSSPHAGSACMDLTPAGSAG